MSVSSGSDVTIPIQDSPPPPPSPYANRNGEENMSKTPEPRGDVIVNTGIDNEAYQVENKDDKDSKDSHNTQITMNGAGDAQPPLNEALNSELINLNILNTIPDKPQPEFGPYDNFDEYFIPVNQHKKFLRRSEKLYVTKDKRKQSQWKKYICWIIGAFILAAIVTVAVLAGVGLIPQKSANSFVTDSVVGTTPDFNSPISTTTENRLTPALSPSTSTEYVSTTTTTTSAPSAPLDDTYVPNTADVEFHLNDLSYEAALNDKTTDRFRELASELEQEMKHVLKRDAGLESTFARVIQFAPGSVHTKMRIGWVDDKKNMDEIKMALAKLNTFGSHIIMAVSSFGVVNHCKFANNGCSNFCTFDYESLEFLCTCPELMLLGPDKKTCNNITVPTPEGSPDTEVDTSPETTGSESSESNEPQPTDAPEQVSVSQRDEESVPVPITPESVQSPGPEQEDEHQHEHHHEHEVSSSVAPESEYPIVVSSSEAPVHEHSSPVEEHSFSPAPASEEPDSASEEPVVSQEPIAPVEHVSEEPISPQEPVVSEEPIAPVEHVSEEPISPQEPVVSEESVSPQEPAVSEEPIAPEEPKPSPSEPENESGLIIPVGTVTTTEKTAETESETNAEEENTNPTNPSDIGDHSETMHTEPESQPQSTQEETNETPVETTLTPDKPESEETGNTNAAVSETEPEATNAPVEIISEPISLSTSTTEAPALVSVSDNEESATPANSNLEQETPAETEVTRDEIAPLTTTSTTTTTAAPEIAPVSQEDEQGSSSLSAESASASQEGETTVHPENSQDQQTSETEDEIPTGRRSKAARHETFNEDQPQQADEIASETERSVSPSSAPASSSSEFMVFSDNGNANHASTSESEGTTDSTQNDSGENENASNISASVENTGSASVESKKDDLVSQQPEIEAATNAPQPSLVNDTVINDQEENVTEDASNTETLVVGNPNPVSSPPILEKLVEATTTSDVQQDEQEVNTQSPSVATLTTTTTTTEAPVPAPSADVEQASSDEVSAVKTPENQPEESSSTEIPASDPLFSVTTTNPSATTNSSQPLSTTIKIITPQSNGNEYETETNENESASEETNNSRPENEPTGLENDL